MEQSSVNRIQISRCVEKLDFRNLNNDKFFENTRKSEKDDVFKQNTGSKI